MTDDSYSTILDIPASMAWAVVRDFGGLPTWFPFVSQSVLSNGAWPTEVGIVRDDTVDKGATAVAEGDRTFAVWTVRSEPVGDPAEIEERVRHGIFKTCLDELERVEGRELTVPAARRTAPRRTRTPPPGPRTASCCLRLLHRSRPRLIRAIKISNSAFHVPCLYKRLSSRLLADK